MLELLFYFLCIGPFLMNKAERERFGVMVLMIVAFLWIGSLFYD